MFFFFYKQANNHYLFYTDRVNNPNNINLVMVHGILEFRFMWIWFLNTESFTFESLNGEPFDSFICLIHLNVSDFRAVSCLYLIHWIKGHLFTLSKINWVKCIYTQANNHLFYTDRVNNPNNVNLVMVHTGV